MSVRATKLIFLLASIALLALPGSIWAQDARTIVTTQDADYFGFDLRTEKDVSLDACTAVCLADPECRAFTYNRRAQWCFLKSDYNTINPFAGAVAGKVVSDQGEPDIGAPPALEFVTDAMHVEARRYRAELTAAEPTGESGLVYLSSAAGSALASGDPRSAAEAFHAALSIEPSDPELWIGLARAKLDTPTDSSEERRALVRDGTSAALNGYLLTRTKGLRAGSLATVALALDRNNLYRPALQAYEASLALTDDVAVRAAYLDLKARKGFRVVGNRVEADLAAPRACVQFSEKLVKAGTDYATFITVDGSPARAVEAKGKQLCVDGLEHGKQYGLVLRQGLPSSIGEVLEAPVSLTVYVRDRLPSIRFSTENFVLPAAGRHGIPMVSVNAPTAALKLHRVGDRALASLLDGYLFLRQINSYDVDSLSSNLGEPVWEGTIALANELNKEILTSFPVGEALAERRPGVYVLTATPEGDKSESWNERATQWFVVSDIGLTTYSGSDGLTVFARSLETAEPLAGVTVQLLAKNNEILGQATTDDHGHATLSPGLMRGTAAMAPAILTAAKGESDFVFLDMTRGGFDLSDRGVTGRLAPGAIDVFAWTERGIYRAGEKVHTAALARNASAEAVQNLPLTFIYTRPDGVEERRVVSDGRSLGGHHAPLTLQSTAQLGTWSVRVHSDPNAAPLAQLSFLVEEFVPDRIEFDLAAETPEIDPGESATLSVDGRFLYGAPASGMELEGEMQVATAREWDFFPGYQFGLADEELDDDNLNTELEIEPTDEDGKATFEVVADELPSTTRLLQAKVVVRMREPGGRAVERDTIVNIRPEQSVIGIRPDFSGNEVPENSTAGFRIIAASPDGNREALPGANWTLTKIERNYQWYRSNNSWNYEAVTLERRISSGRIDIAAEEPSALTMPVEWGRYRLDVASADPAGPVASFEFNAGWFVAASSTETPDGLEIALDREKYAAGDTARLKVSPRFAGQMLVAIGSEQLFQTMEITVPAEGTEVEIPVSAEWGGGAYVTATLYRPADTESRMPGRAIGVKWLAIDPAERTLTVEIDAPASSKSRESLHAPVRVSGLTPGEEAYVTIAAVDVGILNLTRYSRPDPEGWYFGQRRLGMELRDLYGRLIDGSAGAFGRLRTGGDGNGGMAIQGSPPTEELVAFFSGILPVDAEGRAEYLFDMPEFNGTARLMVVAWSGSAVGKASADVVVRDPIVITAGQPRFLAVGDQATIRLDIHNTDGETGEYALDIRSEGSAGLEFGDTPRAVMLTENGREALQAPITALSSGESKITITLSRGDISVERSLHLPVRQPAMPVTSQRIVSLGAGGSLRIDDGLLADSLMDGASVTVGVSPLAALDIPSLLMTLDRYPYGCTEQTISRALPLLYVSDLSAAAGMEDDPALRERVQKAVDRVLTAQSSSGSFGLWGPNFGDMWLDAYVTDFLTRVREAGYDVPERSYANAIENLRNQLAYTTDLNERGTEIAYALYVMARNRKASVGDLRYYADTRIEEFSSPMARAQIAAALALYGDNQRADAVFDSALRQAQATRDSDLPRSDYGSPLRDGAAILALAAESRPSPAVVPAVTRFVVDERARKRWTSTQEEVWMVLAARAISENADQISLEVDGAPHSGRFARRMTGEELLETPLLVANRGKDAVDAVITTVAAPSQPLPAGGDGFSIERSYYTLDGEPANITEARQNDRYVVVLQAESFNDWPARIVMTDLLPAGFEIDNPRLVGSAELANFEWLGEASAAHSEFRADRFTAAFDRNEQGTFYAAYVVRAVTPGIYNHPAAIVQDMYRPQYHARTSAGMMEVIEAQ